MGNTYSPKFLNLVLTQKFIILVLFVLILISAMDRLINMIL